jgi:hypothetical protein
VKMDLTSEFAKLAPWIFKFRIDGTDYGGAISAVGDVRVEQFQTGSHANAVDPRANQSGRGVAFGPGKFPGDENALIVDTLTWQWLVNGVTVDPVYSFQFGLPSMILVAGSTPGR